MGSMDESEPRDIPEPPETGDEAVDAALVAVARVAAGPAVEQLTGYEAAHRSLADRLADVDG
jgi:hypothetical protein